MPLWIAGVLHKRNLERMVKWGDAWIPIMGASVDDIADGTRRIKEAWTAAGRDPGVLQVQAPLRQTPVSQICPDGQPSVLVHVVLAVTVTMPR